MKANSHNMKFPYYEIGEKRKKTISYYENVVFSVENCWSWCAYPSLSPFPQTGTPQKNGDEQMFFFYEKLSRTLFFFLHTRTHTHVRTRQNTHIHSKYEHTQKKKFFFVKFHFMRISPKSGCFVLSTHKKFVLNFLKKKFCNAILVS